MRKMLLWTATSIFVAGLSTNARCGRLVPDAHGAQSTCDDGTIDPITVPDQVVRSLIPKPP